MNTAVRILIYILAGVLAMLPKSLQARTVAVEAVDSVSGEGVPYVAVYLTGTSRGALADESGRTLIELPDRGDVRLEMSAMGYDKKSFPVNAGITAVRVFMRPTGVALDEVVVHRGKEHYTKKNNPAVAFMERIRKGGELTDPRRNEFFRYSKHERLAFGLNEMHLSDTVKGKFSFLKEHVDTSDVTGKQVLPLSVKEKVSDIVFRREPRDEKELVRGIRQNGVDEVVDLQSMQTLLEDAFREIDLYENDINILQNRFVSPLSVIAPDFYKFYLSDTIADYDGTGRLIELSFAPRNPASFGFTGRLYVEDGDSTMFVRRVLMNVPAAINLNFIEKLQIAQTFDRAPDGSRLKEIDDFYIELAIIKGTQGLYARRTTAYGDYSFSPPEEEGVFDRPGRVLTDTRAFSRDEEYWEAARMMAVSSNEKRIDALMRRLRSVPLYYYSEKALKILVGGYVRTGNPSKIDIGPVNTFFSGNTLEGFRMRVGAMTTANLSRHWFARGYAAYGFRDKKFKYNAEVEYSFNEKRYHSREFPVHSLRLTQRYDVDQLGQHYLFTNPDNVFLALKRQKNELMTYLRETRLEYTLEMANNLSFLVSANYQRQEASEFVPFRLPDGGGFNHYDEMLFGLRIRYAPGEKFFQTKSARIPVNMDAPVIVLSHDFAPGGFLGSRFCINRTELSVQKRFWFSAFGYADVLVKGGHVWSHVPFPALLTPNANLSYTIQPESYALLTPMEFMGDSFASWDVTYWANGALFNLIPYVKKLKLREVVAFRGWWGHLSDRNNPQISRWLPCFPENIRYTPMNGKPYMEISAGIDNLFKCLRVDYVWRLNYRDVPGRDRSGLRVALHITF